MTRTFVLSDAKIIRKDTEAFWRHNWHLKDNCDHMQPVAYDYIPREPECWRATEEQLAPHRCWSETMPSRLNNRSHFFENNKRHMVAFAIKDTWPVLIESAEPSFSSFSVQPPMRPSAPSRRATEEKLAPQVVAIKYPYYGNSGHGGGRALWRSGRGVSTDLVRLLDEDDLDSRDGGHPHP